MGTVAGHGAAGRGGGRGRQDGPEVARRLPGDAARLVLGQRRGDDHSHEITAIPALLEMLVLEGCIVTLDAMGCQTRIAQTLRDRGADYVLALKGNQPPLHEAVVETFAVEQADAFEGCVHDFPQTVNKGRGRIETRRGGAMDTPEHLRYVDPDGAWPDRQSLVLIEARRTRGSCCGPCAATGVSGTVCTGSWTWLSGRTRAASAPATPPTTWRAGAAWPSTCCAARPRPRAASPPNASRPVGTTGTCSRSCQVSMRWPWCARQRATRRATAAVQSRAAGWT